MGVCVSVSTGNRAVARQPTAPPGESREEGEEGTPCSSSVQSLPAATPGMQIEGGERRPLGLRQTCPPLPGAAPGAEAPGRPCPGTEGGRKPSLNPGKPLTSLRNRGSKASSLFPGLGEEQGGCRCEHLVSPKQQGQAPGGPAGCSGCGWGAVPEGGIWDVSGDVQLRTRGRGQQQVLGAPRITHRAWTGFGVVLLGCLHFRVTSAPSAPSDLVFTHHLRPHTPTQKSRDSTPGTPDPSPGGWSRN